MDNQENIINSHRNMLMFSKKLSEFQLNNLKNWPAIFFEDVKSHTLSYDFINEKEEFCAGSVSFDIQTENSSQDFQKSIDYLTMSVRLMFWSDTVVVVKINGKIWKTKSQNTKKTSRTRKKNPSKSLSKTDAPA